MKKIFLVVLIAFLLVSCSNEKESEDDYAQSASSNVEDHIIEEEDEVEEEVIEDIEIRLSAVGDIMYHKTQLQKSYDYSTDSFDFSSSFHHIDDYLLNSDFLVGNLETTLAGRDKNIVISGYEDEKFAGYTGYPCFNTPQILAKNMKDVGFDLVSTANNHSMDSGEDGVITTIEVLQEVGIQQVGTYKSQEHKDEVMICDIEGINIAFSSYTYGMNGFTLPSDQKYLVNTFDMYDEIKIEEMYEEVREISKEDIDFNVVMIHFGNEYKDFENEHQRSIVDGLFDAGADIILGSHPHVLQPIEIREIERDGEVKNGLVIYSLGNFISSQRYSESRPHQMDIGLILNMDLVKENTGESYIKSISLVPTLSYWSDEEISVIPVLETYENIDECEIVLDQRSRNRLEYSYANTIEHITSYIELDGGFINYEYRIDLN